jgi:hypothetical protein
MSNMEQKRKMIPTPHIDRAIVEVTKMQETKADLEAKAGNLNEFYTFHQVSKLNQSCTTNFITLLVKLQTCLCVELE